LPASPSCLRWRRFRRWSREPPWTSLSPTWWWGLWCKRRDADRLCWLLNWLRVSNEQA